MSRIISDRNNSTMNVIKKRSKMHFTVSFDANGGTCAATDREFVFPDDIYDTLPTPTKDGYKFTGWFTAREHGSGKKVLVSDIAEAKHKVLYAHWVKLNLDGGTISPNDPYKDADMNDSTTWNTLPSPTKGANFFAGWYANEEHGENNDHIYTFTEIDDSITDIYAHFLFSGAIVTFNAEGGTCDTASREYAPYEPYNCYGLPVPSKNGYVFDGWYAEHVDESTNETVVDFKLGLNMSSRVPRTGFTAHAHWVEISGNSVVDLLNSSSNALYLKNEPIDVNCSVFDTSNYEWYSSLDDGLLGYLALSDIFAYAEADSSVIICGVNNIITQEVLDKKSLYPYCDEFRATGSKVTKKSSQLHVGDVIADDVIVDGEVLFEAGHVISGEDALKCSGNVIGWSIKGSDGAISIASYSLYGKNGLNIKFESPYYYADSPTLIMTSLFDGNISFSYRGDGTGTSYSYIDIDAWYKIDGTSTKFVACRNEISGNLAEWQEISRDLTALTDFEMWMYLDYAYFDDEYHNSLYVSDIEFTPSVPVP